MGLAVTAAMQWIALGTLPAALEWAMDYPGHLLMTALLYAVPVYILGTVTAAVDFRHLCGSLRADPGLGGLL